MCKKLNIPFNRHEEGLLFIEGSTAGKNFTHTGMVKIARNVDDTFISTDKFLYKPGQTVKFRLMTIQGPFLRINTDVVSIQDTIVFVIVRFIF